MSFSNADTGDKTADPYWLLSLHWTMADVLDRYKANNQDEPGTEQKITDLTNFIKGSKFGMMTTYSSHSGTLASRCMAVAATVSSHQIRHNRTNFLQEHNGIDLIFHTNTESGKTDDLQQNSAINMAFLNGSGEWASVSGEAEIDTDRETVKKYYSQELKAWLGDLGDGTHDGGPMDPRIGVIRIKTKTATYAISLSNPISRGIEVSSTVNSLRSDS